MDIVIVAQYLRNIEDLSNNNGRFINIARLLSEVSGNSVEIITSNFLHGEKRHVKKIDTNCNFKITALDEPGYPKNVCLKRIYSHSILAKNVKQYLQGRKKPDCIYCAIPSLSVAKVASDYCKENNIRFMVDIQDLWPEAFKMAINIPVVSDIIFYPMKKQADSIFAQADEIVAVSKTYCERALKVNRKCKEVHPVFLGTKLEVYDANASDMKNEVKTPLDKDKLKLAYCGTLGKSYDLITIFDALEIIKKKGIDQIQFVVMGDGPRRYEFEEYAKRKKLDVIFTGELKYPCMCWLLNKCDITVNPIIGSSAASIINKHADYAASGKPVINTQTSKEYRELVEEYNMGFNCKNGDAIDVAKKLKLLIEDNVLRISMGKYARKCAEERFDRKNSYKNIISLILK